MDFRGDKGCRPHLTEARRTKARGRARLLAFMLLSSLGGCDDQGISSLSQQGAEPLAAASDREATAPREPEPMESEGAASRGRDVLETSELTDADANAPKAPVFVLQASRDVKSIDIGELRAGRVRLPPLLLTADIAGAPLREVLAELSQAIGVKIFVADPVSAKAISIKFEKLPVEEGIKRILKGNNYTLTRRAQPTAFAVEKSDRGDGKKVSASSEEMAVAEIRVFSRDSKADVATLKELGVADTRRAAQVAALAKQALEAETAKARSVALAGFVEQADRSQLTGTLVAALKDEDASVRLLALESMADGEDPPLEPVAGAALLDESPSNRRTAVDALLSIHGAAAIPTLEQALKDPDPAVQKTARSALETALAIEKLDLENEAAGNE